MKEERIEWVDIAKGIGIGCVVMGHIFSSQMLAHKVIFLFHMPLFFFVSGFLYKRQSDNKAYIIRKAKSLLVPYFSVFAFVFPILIFAYMPEGYTLNMIAWDTLYYVLGGCYLRGLVYDIFIAMWFITCLFLVQVIYNYIQTRFKERTIHVVIFIMLIGAYINSIIYPGFWLPWSANVTLMAIPVYHLGYISRQINVDKYSILFIIAGLLICASLIVFPQNTFDMMRNSYGIPFVTLISAIICIYMVRYISVIITKNSILKRILSEFGKASLVIMAFHLPVYQLLWKYFEISSIPAIIVITIIPYLFYRIFDKFKITQMLFLGKFTKINNTNKQG